MKILIGRHLDERQIQRLQRAAPQATFVCAADREEVLKEIRDADAYLHGPWDDEILAAAEQVCWVHFWSAGVDSHLTPALRSRDVRVTNSADIFSVPIAEHALGLMLALARCIHMCVRPPGQDPWHGPKHAMRGRVRELYRSTLGIVGYGGIGRETARRARGLGMRVLALRRHPQPDEFADAVWGTGRLEQLLAQSDWVLVSCALTEQTRGLIGPRGLALMKREAMLINVARGPIVDGKALLRALQQGWIAGAGLDVTEPEPLPPHSPLWDMPNVIITPHVGGAGPRTGERLFELTLENVRRYAAGKQLLNVVDKRAGY